MINSIASHYKFDIDTPFKELSNNIQDIILYGSGDEEIKVRKKQLFVNILSKALSRIYSVVILKVNRQW